MPKETASVHKIHQDREDLMQTLGELFDLVHSRPQYLSQKVANQAAKLVVR